MRTTRHNQYAILYKAYGKWNWYERSTWSKATVKSVANGVAKEMKAKVKIAKATMIFQEW